jgi:hypothetical protein
MPRKSRSQPRISRKAGENASPAVPAAVNAAPVTQLGACASPDARANPQFVIYFRRPLALTQVAEYPVVAAAIAAAGGKSKGAALGGTVQSSVDTPVLACVAVLDMVVELGLDARYLQTWNLTGLSIGDLASTMGLAPLEQLTLEFQSTQRKVMDRSVVDSAESMDSSESTTSDKEAVNVTRSTVKTEGWHIDATGSVSYKAASLQVQGGYSKSVTQTNQQSIDRVTEATKKSAHNLKTLHKIEVHGVSESVVSNRMTRVLRNPYYDRTLSVNVYQLLKHFNVVTALDELRTAILLTINEVQFDSDFVLANADFLRNSLLDSGLVDALDTAFKGAQPPVLTGDLATAGQYARRGLQLLFSDAINMFNMAPRFGVDPNKPSVSFDASAPGTAFTDTGLGDAHETNFGLIFTVLNFYYTLTHTDGSGKVVDEIPGLSDEAAIQIAISLAADMKDKMALLLTDPKDPTTSSDIKDIIDDQQLTEGIRRMFGFVAMVNGMLTPLLQPAAADQTALTSQYQARFTLNRLLGHLNCNSNYYIQEYLLYVANQTRNQAIVDLATQILGDPYFQIRLQGASASDFDPTTAFVSQRQIIIPGAVALTGANLSALGRELFKDGTPVADPQPGIVDVDVPCDGIHLEVAEGACVLANVPPPPTNSVSLTVQGASLGINK